MLLEASLSGFTSPDSQLNRFDRLRMGLLDTTNNTSRLISAMLADQPQDGRPHQQHPPPSYSSQTVEHRPHTIGYSPYDMSRRPATSSQQKPGPYMSDNQSSESDSRSPKSLAVPTCVVAPSANQRHQEMDRHQEMERHQDSGRHDDLEQQQDMEGEDSSGGLPYIPSRKQREFIPENRKDDGYWEKRRKNNEAARRSREKRRYHDMALENRIMDLTRDNCKLRNELTSIKKRFGMPMDDVAGMETSEHPGTPQGPTHMNTVSPNRNNPHMSQSILNTELQQQSRPPSAVHQSPPPRSKHSSGSLHPSHYLSFYNQQHNVPSQFTPAQISADAIYRGRSVQEATDMKHLFSGKFDAQSPMSMKSMPEEVTVQQRRIEDQLRPMYSSSLPPNQAPPYHMNPLAVSSPKSYWVPTTEMTSSDSNDDSEWNDQIQDQPLSLVKKRPSTENESGSDLSNNSSRASTSPPTSSSSALPHKLRHKLTQEYVSNSMSPAISPYTNGLAHLSDVALSRQAFPSAIGDDYQLDSYRSRSRSYSNPRSQYDTKYVERRKKNNEAARKCRENRKSLTRIREVKSGYLENENNKLKDELGNLQDEMRELREMLEKKRQEKEMESMAPQNHQQGDKRADSKEDEKMKDDGPNEVAVKIEAGDVGGNVN